MKQSNDFLGMFDENDNARRCKALCKALCIVLLCNTIENYFLKTCKNAEAYMRSSFLSTCFKINIQMYIYNNILCIMRKITSHC